MIGEGLANQIEDRIAHRRYNPKSGLNARGRFYVESQRARTIDVGEPPRLCARWRARSRRACSWRIIPADAERMDECRMAQAAERPQIADRGIVDPRKWRRRSPAPSGRPLRHLPCRSMRRRARRAGAGSNSVAEAQCLREIRHRRDGDDRSEKLLPHGDAAGRHVGQDGGLKKMARQSGRPEPPPAEDELRPGAQRPAHLILQLSGRIERDQRSRDRSMAWPDRPRPEIPRIDAADRRIPAPGIARRKCGRPTGSPARRTRGGPMRQPARSDRDPHPGIRFARRP